MFRYSLLSPMYTLTWGKMIHPTAMHGISLANVYQNQFHYKERLLFYSYRRSFSLLQEINNENCRFSCCWQPPCHQEEKKHEGKADKLRRAKSGETQRNRASILIIQSMDSISGILLISDKIISSQIVYAT